MLNEPSSVKISQAVRPVARDMNKMVSKRFPGNCRFQAYEGQSPLNRLLLFLTRWVTTRVINCAQVHCDRSKSFGVAGVRKLHVPAGKRIESFIIPHCITVRAVKLAYTDCRGLEICNRNAAEELSRLSHRN